MESATREDPAREEIERLAYQLWLERGRPVGTPQQDWDRAERLLKFSHQDAGSPELPDAPLELSDSSLEKVRLASRSVEPRLSDVSPAAKSPAATPRKARDVKRSSPDKSSASKTTAS